MSVPALHEPRNDYQMSGSESNALLPLATCRAMRLSAHTETCVEKRTAFDRLGAGRRIPRTGNGDQEAPLIERLRAGDPSARTVIVRRYHSALVHQASRVLRDEARAEDVVQDAWLAAFACIHGFTLQSNLFTWLVRIVINRAKAVRRREVRSLPFSACATRAPEAGGHEELELPALTSDESSPERLLLEREAVRRFNEALQALPESQRAVLLLRDFAGASASEACRVLRINDLAHRVRLCRARASIRQALHASGVAESTRRCPEDVRPMHLRPQTKHNRRLSRERIGLASALTN